MNTKFFKSNSCKTIFLNLLDEAESLSLQLVVCEIFIYMWYFFVL